MLKRRAKGQGSIERRKDRWRAVLPSQTGSATFDTRAEAAAWLKANSPAKPKPAPAKPATRAAKPAATQKTVGEWLDQWQAIASLSVSEGTATQYEQIVRLHLKPGLGGIKLAELKPLDIANYYARAAKDSVSACMLFKVATTLRTALKEAVNMELIPTNPALQVKKPRAEPKTFESWDAAETRTFLAASRGERLHALFALAVDSGMRQGELLGLHWPEVDAAAGSVLVKWSLKNVKRGLELGRPKTAASRRTVGLTPTTLAALARHREQMRAEGRDVDRGPVFVRECGGFVTQSTCKRAFDRAVREADVRQVRFHDIRHTCATLLLAAGVHMKAVSTRLGHASVGITLDIYTHVLPSTERHMIDVLDAVMRGDNAA